MATQQTMVNWAKDQIYKWIDMDGAMEHSALT